LSEYVQVKESINKALVRMVGDELAGLGQKSENWEEARKAAEGKERTLAVLSYDVDRIKELVFSSTKPLEVNGASEIINDLSEGSPTDSSGKPPYCSVYRILQDFNLISDHVMFAGGGSGILLLPADLVETIAHEIKERFKKATISGTCSVVWQYVHLHELFLGLALPDNRETVMPGVDYMEIGQSGSAFGTLLRLLADKMRQEKETKMRAAAASLPGFIKRCKSCGFRAASEYDSFEGTEDAYLCTSCYRHRERGREERQRPGLAVAKTIEEIAGGENEDQGNYVAAIYADANAMGNMLLKLNNMEELSLFSRIVTRVIGTVRDELVKRHHLEKRYQAPVIGGDDILLIVSASKAVGVVVDLYELFREKIKQEAASLEQENRGLSNLIKEMTLSAGFVIVPQHFNIRFLVEYAEVMLNEAKKGYRLKENECVDFLVLTDGSPLSYTPGEMRDRFYVNNNGGNITLTRRPLTVEELKVLAADIKSLKKNVSRYQLKSAQSLLYNETPAVARLNLRYQWVRIAHQWDWLFQNNKSGFNYWLNMLLEEDKSRPGYYHSSISDIMELYSYVEA